MKALRMMVGFMCGLTTIVAVLWLLSVLWQAPILILAVVLFPISLLFLPLVPTILAVVHTYVIIALASLTVALFDGS
ncbi:hypothetical protein LCGC14_0491230 [marine sediment metagenome]|uniref:Uncharacterized protein n=1 Tax=marine sediment metagenome TaxID=412755 RepID=A0A0F9S6L0_9ZZZZ